MSKKAHRPTRLIVAAPAALVLLFTPLLAHAEPSETEPKPEIGLSEQDRAGVAQILEGLLVDEYALYTTTWNYHWNVEGIEFYQLHELFGEQYQELAKNIDRLAERIQAIGYRADVMHAEDATRLPEDKGQHAPNDIEMIKNLVAGQERVTRGVRSAADAVVTKYHDIVTQNLLQDTALMHEKMAWMLRSHLAKSGEPAFEQRAPTPLR